MKKLFTFFAAALFACVAFAADQYPDPSKSNSLASAIIAVGDGETVWLDDTAPYVNHYASEGGDDYTKLRSGKKITIKAIEGKSPTIKLEVPFQVREAVNAKFIGVKFDGSSITHYDYYFYFYENANNVVEFEDCEFTNIGSGVYLIYIGAGKKASKISFDKCNVHDIATRILNQGTVDNFVIKDSKFSSFANYPVYDNYDNGTTGSITIEGSEFDNLSYGVIHNTSAAHVGTCIIDDCYFHDGKRTAIFFEAPTSAQAQVDDISVTNSTFANYTAESYYASIIDIRNGGSQTALGKVLVDYCTFYNCKTINTDHVAIRVHKSTDATVSNCIFYDPNQSAEVDASKRAATNLYGGNIKNCIAYNYLYGTEGHFHNGATFTSCSQADPKFVDAENNDFTLSAGSRALEYAGKAVDGTTDSILNLGDPLWVPEPRTLYCEMTQSWWTVDGAAIGCYAWNGADANKVENAAYPGVRMTPVANENGVWTIQLSRKYDNVIFTRMNPSDQGDQDWGYKTYDLALPVQWDYYTITATSAPGDQKAAGAWKKLNPTLENGWYLIGTFDGVEEKTFETLTAEKLFVVNPSNANEYIVTANLKEGDKFKAAYVYYDQINDYKPNGVGDEYVIDEWHTGVKTIVFNETYQGSWGGHFYITRNEPVVTYSDFEIDLRDRQLGTEGSNMQKYLTVGEPYVYSDDMPIAYNAILRADNFNGYQHGYTNLVVTMPVEATNYYKVTLGTCEYGTGTGSIMKADGSVTYKTFDQKTAACYDANPATNVVSTVFSVAEAQTIKIVCGNYTPYIKVEQVANLEYFVRFEVGEGVRGIVPSPVYIPAGDSYTIPANRTLYKDNNTLTGWTDGVNTYAPGQDFTPKDDATLTAVFTENTANLLTATVPVTVQWNFGQTEGAPAVAWQGETKGMGFLVAQATIGSATVDVPLDIDARSGKFANSGRTDYYAQVNAGTLLYFPAKKDAVVEVFTYADPATSDLDGNTKTGAWTDNKAIFNTTKDTGSSIFTATDGQYYRYLKVTYPASEATSISNTEAGEKAQKMIENGQIVIIKNGVKYNVLGVSLK